jgi:uncharacterized delta-60 repeat protein
MIHESRIITTLTRGKLLCLAVCLTLAGALMLTGTSFAAWIADSAFNPSVTCPNTPDPTECVEKVLELPNGQVLIGGFIGTVNGTNVNYIARLTANGSLDTTFMPTLDNSVESIVTDSTGSIIIGGHFTQVNGTTRLGIARLNANGALDPNFNPRLNNCDPAEPNTEAVTALAFQSDGNLLVGGTFKNVNITTCPTYSLATGVTDTSLRPFFVRLLTAGTGTGAVDTSFNPNVSSTVTSITPLDTGSYASNKQILVGGVFYKINCTYCGSVSSSGSYTTTMADLSYGPTVTEPACLDSDGTSTVDYGQCLSNNSSNNPENYPPIHTADVSYIVFINESNGSQTGSFNSQRIVGEDLVNSVVLQSDGTVVVGGNVESLTSGQPYLQRMLSDGSIDGSWNPNVNGPVSAVFSSPSGTQLISGGTFSTVNGLTFNNVALFTSPSGSLDPTFNPNTNGLVESISSSPSGTNIIIGGGFTQVGTLARSYIARLSNDGKTTTSTSIIAPISTYGSGTVTVTVTGAPGTPTGSVGLSIDSGPTTSLTLNGSGSALFSTATVSAGNHALTATYGATATYETSFATGSLTVLPATLLVTANSVSRPYLTPNPSLTESYTGFVNGQTVSSALSGSPTLTTTALLSSLTGTYPIFITAGTGTGSLTAVNYGFNFVNGVLTITAATSSTSVISSSLTSTYGSSVTFTATVNSTATGSVTFKDGGTTLGVGIVSSGTATYSTPLLSAGTHTITAVYSGDTDFAGSTSSAITQTVNKMSTTSSVVSSSPSSSYGNSVTFTATVVGNGATGTVTFKDGVTSLGTGTLTAGTATYSTSLLSAGTHTITVVYSGDTNFATSTSSPIPQNVGQLTSTTIITSPTSGTSVNYGALVTFTASVTSGATGTVTFYDGGSPIGTGPLLSGIASFSTSSLGVATSPHSITASYGGDTNYSGSTTSSSVAVLILRTTTVTGISDNNIQSSGLNQNVTFTATVVSTTSGIPAGTVQFYDGSSGLGSPVTLSSSGTATFVYAFVSTGTHTITATYSGDPNFNLSSTVTPLIQNVALNITTTTISLITGSNPSAYGTLLTFSSSVTSTGGTPTGTVTFKDNGSIIIGTSTLTSGIATLSTSTLGGGSNSITATYSGDVNYGGSVSSPALSQTVTPVAQSITFGALAPQTYANNGTVVLGATDSSGLAISYGSSNPGVATVSGNIVTIVSAGSTTITASQSGNSNYTAAANVSQLLTVNQAPQTIPFGALTAQTYGNGTIALPATASSGLTVSYGSSNPGVATVSGNIVTIVSVGTTTITASQAGNVDYTAAANVSQLLTVNKATLTVTANSVNRPYLASNPTFSWTYNGFVNSDTQAVLSGSPALSTTATTSSPQGAYPITITQGNLSATNYTFSFVNGTLTVGLMPQSIIFSPLTTVTYGNADFSPGAAASSGLPVSYASSNTVVATIIGSNIHIVGAGATTITASQPGDGSTYGVATPVLQPLTVNPAALIVTANNASRAYNAANPTFTANYSGFVNGDTAAVVSGTPVLTTTATTASQPGSYPITVSIGTLSAANYTFSSFVPGTLTVGLQAQSITFGSLLTGAVGDADFAPGAAASSGLQVSYVSSNTAVATIVGNNIHIVGAGTTTITASQAGNSDYGAANSMQQTLNVDIADGTISGTGTVSVTDALEALRIAAGIDTPTQTDLEHLDVAPLVNGQRHPDGKIDISDVVVILRKAAGLPSW